VKTKRQIIIVCLAVLIAAYVIGMVPIIRSRLEYDKTVKALQSLSPDRVYTAVQSFTRDRKATNGVVQASASLQELVSGGYLSAEDIRGLQGRDVSVSLTTDESNPSAILIRVHLASGRDAVLMHDGSIMLLPRP
jgi:hypothetical protein